jgi:hypothetical protein
MDVGEVMSRSRSSRQTRILLLVGGWHSFDAQTEPNNLLVPDSMRSRISHNTQHKRRGAAMLTAIET